jgi:hypothetical protein
MGTVDRDSRFQKLQQEPSRQRLGRQALQRAKGSG